MSLLHMNLSPSDFRTLPAPSTLALLVDAENIHGTRAAELLTVLPGPRIRRAYGAFQHIQGWADHGFRLCPTRPGKNSADMLLCVEAMMLCLRDGIETVAIASSDRDFSYLAEQLREAGKTVIGIGPKAAPASFRNSCSQFHELAAPAGTKAASDAPATAVAMPPAQAPEPRPATLPDKIPVAKLRRMIADAGPDGMRLAMVNSDMWDHGVRISELPEKTWRKWFKVHGTDFDLSEGHDPVVRLRRALSLSCRSAP